MLTVLGREVDKDNERENARFLREVSNEIQPYVWGIGLFVVLMFTGAGTTVLSQGILLLGVGLSLLCIPSVHRVSGAYVIGMGLLSIVALHAWIPVDGFSLGEWREVYLGDPDSQALPILGPNFGDHIVSWLLLLAGVVWLTWVLSFKIRSESAHAVLWIVAVVIALLSVGVMLANTLDLRLPFAQDATTFTYFPNRNQTSIVLAVGACIALGKTLYNAMHLRLIAFGFGAILSIVTLNGLLQMQSRGGVLFLFLGLLAFTISASWLTRKSSSLPWLRLGLPCGLLAISLFTLVDAGVRDRMMPLLRGDFSGLGDEFRYAVWSDTLQLIQGEPLGVGLGHYASVIPQYLERASVGKTVLHPESSWLWALAELGWIGFFLVVILAGFVAVLAILSLKLFPNPIRLLAFVAIGILFGHSLVDVGWHRPGLWILGFLLLGVVFRPQTGVRLKEASVMYRWLQKIAALGFMALGLLWLVGSFFGLPVHAQLIAEKAENDAARAVSTRSPQEVLEATERWIAMQPLNWEAHFAQARGYLQAGGSDEALAIKSFRTARYLNPHLADIGMMEGDTWLTRGNAARAFNAWNWMLSRRSENDEELLKKLFMRAWNSENARDQLILLSETQPRLRLKVYEEVELKDFLEMVEGDLEAEELGYPFWLQMPADIRMRWVRTMGWEALQEFVRNNPSFASLLAQWPFRYEGLIGDQKLDEALALFRDKTPLPGIPGNVEEEEVISLERQFRNTNNDPFRGFLVAKKYIELGREADALELLGNLTDRHRDLPSFAYYWEGELLNRSGETQLAADAWSRWILRTGMVE